VLPASSAPRGVAAVKGVVDDVPGYGEDRGQSTVVTRSYEQEHDGQPH
jgi:hypothetical protein